MKMFIYRGSCCFGYSVLILFYTPTLGADDFSGESWQRVIAVLDEEGDILILVEGPLFRL
jgi:hypothetical protein